MTTVLAFYAHLWHAPIAADHLGARWVQARGVVYGVVSNDHLHAAYLQIRGMRVESLKFFR